VELDARRAVSGRPPVRVDVPGRKLGAGKLAHVLGAYRSGRPRRQAAQRPQVGLGQERHDRVAIDAHDRPAQGQGQQIPADATAEIDQRLARGKSGRFVVRHPGVGGLLQPLAGKEHPCRLREFFHRPTAQFDLLQNQSRPGGRKLFAEPTRAGDQRDGFVRG